MYPIVLIALGIAVLLFGKRLSILGAAVGGLVGVVIASLLTDATTTTQLIIVVGMALAGFFAAAFARGIIEVVILVIGALGGAAFVYALLNLFNVDQGLLNWLLAVVGGVVGLMLIRRSRRSSTNDWGMVILADLVGALLILRGLVLLFNIQRDTLIYTLILVGLLVVGFIYQGGFLNRGKKSAPKAAAPPPAATKATAAPPPPAAVAPADVEPRPAPVEPPPVEPPAKPPDSVA